MKKYTRECVNYIDGQSCSEFGGPGGDLPCYSVCE